MKRIEEDSLAELSRLANEIWPRVYDFLLSPEQIDYMLRWMYSPEQLQRDLSEGIRYYWIPPGTSAREALGFVGFGPVIPESPCELHKLYVHPDAQRKGHARRILHELVFPAAFEGGATEIKLRVNRANHPAIQFYKEIGFEKYGESCDEIGSGFVMDDWLMHFPISKFHAFSRNDI